MRKKDLGSEYGINFKEFTVPIVSEAYISAACDKIAASLPVAKTGFKINLHRYGLIAVCAVLLVAVITIVPKFTAPKLNDADLGIHKTEILNTAEDNTENYSDNAEPPEGDADKKAKPAGHENVQGREDSKTGRQTGNVTATKAQPPESVTSRAEPRTTPSPDYGNEETTSEGKERAQPPKPAEALPYSEKAQEPTTENRDSGIDDARDTEEAPAPQYATVGDTSTSDEMSVPGVGGATEKHEDGESRSVAMSAPTAPEGVRIETELSADGHQDSVLFTTGFLNFKEIPEDEKAPTLIQNAARVETWTEEKFTAEFGVNPYSYRSPEDLILTPASVDKRVSVKIMGYGKNEAYKAVFQYLGETSRRLTFDMTKHKGEGNTETRVFNSNINGYNIYAEYIKADGDRRMYSAKLNYQGVEYHIYSENLTQEEFIRALLSVFESK